MPRRGHSASLEYHRTLLDDPHRMAAYDQAIRSLVLPGMRVLDLGCGTGILAMLAAKCGAEVIAVESSEVALLARELVEANGLAAQVEVIHADFCELQAREVDLVVSDFMGRFVVDDGMLEAVSRAADWLAPDGRFCPARVRLQLAPVGDLHMWPVDFFAHPLLGLDLSPALPRAVHTFYIANLRPHTVMAPTRTFATLEPPDVLDERFDAEMHFTIEREGLLRGVAGWFEANLSEHTSLSSGPGIETHWGQLVFPLPPDTLQPGDDLYFGLQLADAGDPVVWAWRARLERSGDIISTVELSSRTWS